jgi:thiamine kinase-like enzyme
MPHLMPSLIDRARRLPCFSAPGRVEMLGGGKTNHNVLVEDGGRAFVVRFGEDIPEHGILRWNELAVARAAERAGLGPAVRHAQPGVLVMDYVAGRPLEAADRADPEMVPRLAALVRRVHHDVLALLEGPVLAFHVFHILADYARQLAGSVHAPLLPDLLAQAGRLQAAIGADAAVLGHNDLLPGNILVGADRLWLIDWEYAGIGSPLFDLGGLASNSGFSAGEERVLLETYHDAPLTGALWRRHAAMKCASLLRETMWSMVSERTSSLDVDYAAYTAQNLAAFRAALDEFDRL